MLREFLIKYIKIDFNIFKKDIFQKAIVRQYIQKNETFTHRGLTGNL